MAAGKVTRLVPERQRTLAGLVEAGLTPDQARVAVLKLDKDQNDVVLIDQGKVGPGPGSPSIFDV